MRGDKNIKSPEKGAMMEKEENIKTEKGTEKLQKNIPQARSAANNNIYDTNIK